MNDERSFTVSPTKNDFFKVDKYLDNNNNNNNSNNNNNNVNNSDVDGSLILETDYYVRQIKQRRNQVKLVISYICLFDMVMIAVLVSLF